MMPLEIEKTSPRDFELQGSRPSFTHFFLGFPLSLPRYFIASYLDMWYCRTASLIIILTFPYPHPFLRDTWEAPGIRITAQRWDRDIYSFVGLLTLLMPNKTKRKEKEKKTANWRYLCKLLTHGRDRLPYPHPFLLSIFFLLSPSLERSWSLGGFLKWPIFASLWLVHLLLVPFGVISNESNPVISDCLFLILRNKATNPGKDRIWLWEARYDWHSRLATCG